MNIKKIIEEYNEVSSSLLFEEYDEDFMFPVMENAPDNKIRLSWSTWTRIENGNEDRHKYITIKEAEEELEKLKKKLEE